MKDESLTGCDADMTTVSMETHVVPGIGSKGTGNLTSVSIRGFAFSAC